jgi:hypothetical protein
VRCLVCGSFQPFLEALGGHEVVCLSACPVAVGAPEAEPAHSIEPQPQAGGIT